VGAEPLSYQWSLNGTNLTDNAHISGSQQNILVFSDIQFSNAGIYQVTISNSLGTVSTNVALTVFCLPPQITSTNSLVQLSNGSIGPVTGTAPLRCQWSRNGTNLSDNERISGTQSGLLQFTPVLRSDAGNYAVTVSNCDGIVTLNVTLITTPVVITNRVGVNPAYEGQDIVITTGGNMQVNDAYDFNSVVVTNAGRLTIASGTTVNVSDRLGVAIDSVVTCGGGSVVNVSGTLSVDSTSVVTCGGTNTSGQISGQWAGQGVTINASNVAVAVGGQISADSQGYVPPGGNNPGNGPGSNGGGGAYGGLGGGGSGGTTYGSAVMPTDLGSSGESHSASGYHRGGAGGGAIRLVVTNTLQLDGSVSANGGDSNTGGGGGSGGSIWVTANTLTGAGAFQANGGSTSDGGGGGGRIAVYYTAGDGFSGYATTTALGGNGGSGGNGQNGTVVFFNNSTANPGLMVDGSGSIFPIPSGSTVTYSSILVTNGGSLLIGGGTKEIGRAHV
jgi:hypothetical protein